METQTIINIRWQDEDETGDIELNGWAYFVEGGGSGGLASATDLLACLRHEGIDVDADEMGEYADTGPIHINVRSQFGHDLATDLSMIYGGENVSWVIR